MTIRLRGAGAGAALAIVAVLGIHFPLARFGIPLLSLFLALTACVYLGALLAQSQRTPVVISELVVGLIVFVSAALGLLVSPVWLVFGYTSHGLWDWAHDIGAISTGVSAWFPPACAVFDFLIAAFLVILVV